MNNFEEVKTKIANSGAKKLHILSDFDRTLTKGIINKKEVKSLMEFFRSDARYISKEYAEKSHALANIYRPIEQNPEIPFEERKKKMEEWWTKHFELLIASGLNKKHLQMMVENIEKEGFLEFREGVKEFFKLAKEKNIPVVIISSSGLGVTIQMILEKKKMMSDNIFIITNEFEWNKNDNAIAIKKPIIHVFNKDETSIKKFPEVFNQIKNRKNVLLLGDSLGDLGMVTGFDYDVLLSFGFLEENVEKNRKHYEEKYSKVLLDNSNFDEINKLLKDIK